MDSWCEVADASSLSPGHCRTVETRGLRVTLVRVEEGFHAVEDTCPHRGASMGSGFLDGCTLHCPLHGWAFDVRTGAGLTRPDKPLRSFPTKVAEGRVWIELGPGPSEGSAA
ncbi:MAG: Rieske 2Fe-2S domain-containing protein [Verrucomicrobia bacterium]|jgi:nitrite reductase (NADH) small subunit|nr:Rieske 2Fe-2S domain-containing protein [Verrucomicrobiota bacterium]